MIERKKAELRANLVSILSRRTGLDLRTGIKDPNDNRVHMTAYDLSVVITKELDERGISITWRKPTGERS